MNSNRGRVLDAKPVTHSNSARVNFANRKKNGDSFVKTLARAWVSPRWAVTAGAGRRVGHAGARARVAVVGRAARLWAALKNAFFFLISSKLINAYSI